MEAANPVFYPEKKKLPEILFRGVENGLVLLFFVTKHEDVVHYNF